MSYHILPKSNSRQIKIKSKSCLSRTMISLVSLEIGLNGYCASSCCESFVTIVLGDMDFAKLLDLTMTMIYNLQFILNSTHLWLMFLFYTVPIKHQSFKGCPLLSRGLKRENWLEVR